MPKVSVIMNCYNSDKFLKQAIDSVYAQTYTDWEIVFWDNQSTDSSAMIAKSYDERLKYFYADEFLPLGAARNKALEKVQGEYVAFLDCDDEWLTEKLEIQMKAFAENPKVEFIYSNSIIINTKYNTKKIALKTPQPSGNIFEEQCHNYSVSILTVIFYKKVLDNHDEWFNKNLAYINDADFFLRLLRNTKALYIEVPLALYRVHGNNISSRNKEVFVLEVRYMIKRFYDLFHMNDDKMQMALNNWLKKADIEEAKLCLKEGKTKEARFILSKYERHSREVKAIILLTYFPPSISRALYEGLCEIYKKYFLYK